MFFLSQTHTMKIYELSQNISNEIMEREKNLLSPACNLSLWGLGLGQRGGGLHFGWRNLSRMQGYYHSQWKYARIWILQKLPWPVPPCVLNTYKNKVYAVFFCLLLARCNRPVPSFLDFTAIIWLFMTLTISLSWPARQNK